MKNKVALLLGIICIFVFLVLYHSLSNLPQYDSFIPKDVQLQVTMLSIGGLFFAILAIVFFFRFYTSNISSNHKQETEEAKK